MLNLGLGAKFHLRCETWLQLVHICIKAADVNASSCSFNTDVSLGLGGRRRFEENYKKTNNCVTLWTQRGRFDLGALLCPPPLLCPPVQTTTAALSP